MYEEYFKHVNMSETEEIKKFVDDEVFGSSEYLFYKTSNDSQIAYCTKCRNEFTSIGLHHNESGICPICGKRVVSKSLRYGRKNCRNEACFYYFEKSVIDDNVVVCKGYYVTKDYRSDYKNPKVDYSLQAIYIFEEKKATMLLNGWYSGWDKRSSIFDFNQGWLAPKMCHCSFESIEEAIKRTWFQFFPYKEFQGYYSMVKLFAEYSKHPGIEQLIKVGLNNLVESKLKGYSTYKAINWNSKDIFKMLKINRKDLKDIKESKVDMTPRFLKLYQLSKKDKSNLKPEDINEVEKIIGYDIDRFSSILKYSSMKKALKYIKKQQMIKPPDKYYNVISTWRDYIEDCKKLNMDLGKESVLYPKDINIAHQNTIKQVKVKEDKQLNVSIAKRLKTLNKYSFEMDGLLIRPAKDSLELLEEGKALKHCVGTYATRYAKGETNIFIIRKINELDKPFYTLEFKNESIVQVRGKGNCAPTKEVVAFVKDFEEAKLKKNKTKIKIPA